MSKQTARLMRGAAETRAALGVAFAERVRTAAAAAEARGATETARRELEGAAEELGAAMAEHAVECLETFVEERLVRAVADRPVLRERWPLGLGARATARVAAAVTEVARALEPADAADGAWKWPAEAAPKDVAEWASQAQPGLREKLATVAAEDTMPPQLTVPRENGEDLEITAYALALVYLGVREVEGDRSRPTVRFGASKYARAAIQIMSLGAKQLAREEDRERALVGKDHETGRLTIAWRGGTQPVQLALEWTDPNMVALRGILDSLHEDGVRDWLLLHRMDAEQGGRGEFVWTWADHRERSAYARRIASRHASEDELQAAVSERLRMLQRAELRIEQEAMHKGQPVKKWIRVGRHGLIDIPAGIDTRGRVGSIAARICLLEELRGVGSGEKDGPGRSFALVSEQALMMSGPELRLAAVLGCERTYAAEESGGVVVRKARYLWETSTLRGGEPSRKERPRTAAALERILTNLTKAGEFGDWRRLDEGPVMPETRYEIRPPRWWRDQVVLRVPPALATTTAGLPRTGEQLRAWREGRGWSQREAAKRLGVGQASVSRAEAGGTATLGDALRQALRAG